MKNNRQCGSSFVGFVWVLIQMLFLFAESFDERRSPVRKIYRHNHEHYLAYPPVQLHIVDDDHIMVDNGILNVSFSISGGMVTGIEYNGIHNLLENENKENNRGYWDVVWTRPDQSEKIDKLGRTRFEVIVQNESQVELSFSRKWDNSSSDDTGLPLNIDKRYIVLRGCSGFYSYAIFERLKGWPAATLYQGRIVFKLQQKLFRYMAISDGKQRIMPTAEDRETGKALDYPEAVLLTNPSNTLLKGEVDDKYQYSSDNKDNRVHGWISQNQPTTGFWMITPSNEFKTAGPIKQDLTSHTGPTTLSMFFSTHYAGESLGIKFANGEPWKKVLGPVFMFVNAVSPNDNPKLLWKNAKKQMIIESSKWPYEFPHSGDHLLANQRGMVSGQLLVQDRYISGRLIYADSAFVGLAPPGLAGSWQTENKGYQFWTRANSIGHFCIPNIRPGTYSLYAWVPGFIGDYKYTVDINIFQDAESY
ncbi:hypothetical protein Leryth_024530 [Lithospermum erythrorhizon]|nr:hypothetical protein Leryth_024530 [Lithospermum erythrorhizon]